MKALENRGTTFEKQNTQHDLTMAGAAAQAEAEAKGDGIPLVKETQADKGPGMLNERQRTWTVGLPNEVSVENPVLYK